MLHNLITSFFKYYRKYSFFLTRDRNQIESSVGGIHMFLACSSTPTISQWIGDFFRLPESAMNTDSGKHITLKLRNYVVRLSANSMLLLLCFCSCRVPWKRPFTPEITELFSEENCSSCCAETLRSVHSQLRFYSSLWIPAMELFLLDFENPISLCSLLLKGKGIMWFVKIKLGMDVILFCKERFCFSTFPFLRLGLSIIAIKLYFDSCFAGSGFRTRRRR